MLGFNGGLVGRERLTTVSALGASGLWLPNEQSVARGAGRWPFGPAEVPSIGDAFQGGYFAGYISHTANGVATHALIVAPRATGASGTGYTIATNLRLKTTRTATLNTDSFFDGRVNTDAMIAAGISLHPAAQFCVNLNIGGFTDWYLPAPAELAIAYANFKPNTTSNVTSSGINAYAVPPRASNWTAGIPQQTALIPFRTSGSEVFEVGDVHWSSRQSSVGAQTQTTLFFSNGSISDGWSSVSVKDAFFRTRAFRRVLL